jgi:hypothetical protein
MTSPVDSRGGGEAEVELSSARSREASPRGPPGATEVGRGSRGGGDNGPQTRQPF